MTEVTSPTRRPHLLISQALRDWLAAARPVECDHLGATQPHQNRMAGSTAEQRQELLGGVDEEEAWGRVEAGPGREGPSVQELIAESSHTVIRTLQRTGVQQVASFSVPVGMHCGGKVSRMCSAAALGEGLQERRMLLGRACCGRAPPHWSGAVSRSSTVKAMGQPSAQHGLPAGPAGAEEAGRGSDRDNGRRQRLPARRGGGLEAGAGALLPPCKGEAPGGLVQRDACGGLRRRHPERHPARAGSGGTAAPEGLLQPLLRRWRAGGCSHTVFSLDFKYERLARRMLEGEVMLFSLWLLSNYAFALSFQVGGRVMM